MANGLCNSTQHLEVCAKLSQSQPTPREGDTASLASHPPSLINFLLPLSMAIHYTTGFGSLFTSRVPSKYMVLRIWLRWWAWLLVLVC